MIPTQAQFDLLFSDYQQLDTPERFGQFIYNRTGFELENSYNETDTEKAWYMLRRAAMINQLTPATDWVKCSERMPDRAAKDEFYLCIVDAHGRTFQKVVYFECGVFQISSEYVITYWMPLSAPPTEVER